MHTENKKHISYREACLADCYDLAVLKGKVWNTTYTTVLLLRRKTLKKKGCAKAHPF